MLKIPVMSIRRVNVHQQNGRGSLLGRLKWSQFQTRSETHFNPNQETQEATSSV
jgi:hypothetical protein